MRTLLKESLVFVFGSFIGCVVKELWCLIKNKGFQIRTSLKHLPLIPIYGFCSFVYYSYCE